MITNSGMTAERGYLRDTLRLLRERAHEAKEAASRTKGDPTSAEFEMGRLQGFYEALSVLYSQLTAFGIDPTMVGLPEDLNLEKELLS